MTNWLVHLSIIETEWKVENGKLSNCQIAVLPNAKIDYTTVVYK